MRQTVVPGLWSWSQWQPDRGLDFNSFFAEHADGNLVVDPLEPDEETLGELRSRGVAAVLVTNRDHERASAAVAAATGAPVVASALAGALVIMPKVADADRAALSLRALRAAHVEHLLVGDGACVFGNAYAALGAALDGRDGVLAGRVNVDELFVVMAGTPTLRTPRGTFGLRPGDVIAFPAVPDGAHRIWNDAAQPADILICL